MDYKPQPHVLFCGNALRLIIGLLVCLSKESKVEVKEMCLKNLKNNIAIWDLIEEENRYTEDVEEG